MKRVMKKESPDTTRVRPITRYVSFDTVRRVGSLDVRREWKMMPVSRTNTLSFASPSEWRSTFSVWP